MSGWRDSVSMPLRPFSACSTSHAVQLQHAGQREHVARRRRRRPAPCARPACRRPRAAAGRARLAGPRPAAARRPGWSAVRCSAMRSRSSSRLGSSSSGWSPARAWQQALLLRVEPPVVVAPGPGTPRSAGSPFMRLEQRRARALSGRSRSSTTQWYGSAASASARLLRAGRGDHLAPGRQVAAVGQVGHRRSRATQRQQPARPLLDAPAAAAAAAPRSSDGVISARSPRPAVPACRPGGPRRSRLPVDVGRAATGR